LEYLYECNTLNHSATEVNLPLFLTIYLTQILLRFTFYGSEIVIMAKKRSSYIGLTILLSLLLQTPVLSDAPLYIIEQQRRAHGARYSTKETDSTENIGGKPRVSSKKKHKPIQVEGSEGSSPRTNSVLDGSLKGGSNPAGATSNKQRKENLGITNPSAGIVTNDSPRDLKNKVLDTSHEAGEKSKPSLSTRDNSALPSGKENNSGYIIPSIVNKTDPNQSGSVNQNPASQNNTPSAVNGQVDSNKSQNNTPSLVNSQVDSNKNQNNTPSLVNSQVDSDVFHSFLRNPFVRWLWWLPVGLIALLLWWLWRRRRLDKKELEDRKQVELWQRIDEHVNQYVDQIFAQKIQNHMQLITQNLVNNNEGLNQYFDQRLQHNLISNPNVSSQIITFVANSAEMNNKINEVYRDIDIRVENLRNEWNQTFIVLLRQYVEELINIIGRKESFNILIASLIRDKVDELLNQIIRTRNELTVIINNADRDLYEWTLGELIAIKGCLTDRQALVEQLNSFNAELITKLECTPCADIKQLKPFRPYSVTHSYTRSSD